MHPRHKPGRQISPDWFASPANLKGVLGAARTLHFHSAMAWDLTTLRLELRPGKTAHWPLRFEHAHHKTGNCRRFFRWLFPGDLPVMEKHLLARDLG